MYARIEAAELVRKLVQPSTRLWRAFLYVSLRFVNTILVREGGKREIDGTKLSRSTRIVPILLVPTTEQVPDCWDRTKSSALVLIMRKRGYLRGLPAAS